MRKKNASGRNCRIPRRRASEQRKVNVSCGCTCIESIGHTKCHITHVYTNSTNTHKLIETKCYSLLTALTPFHFIVVFSHSLPHSMCILCMCVDVVIRIKIFLFSQFQASTYVSLIAISLFVRGWGGVEKERCVLILNDIRIMNAFIYQNHVFVRSPRLLGFSPPSCRVFILTFRKRARKHANGCVCFKHFYKPKTVIRVYKMLFLSARISCWHWHWRNNCAA